MHLNIEPQRHGEQREIPVFARTLNYDPVPLRPLWIQVIGGGY